MSKEGWRYQLRWANPWTSPPNSLPRIIGEWDHEPSMDERLSVYPDYKLGCGYANAIQFPTVEEMARRKLDAATNARRKERARKTLEMNRVRQKLPLLADIIIEQEGLDWRGTACR